MNNPKPAPQTATRTATVSHHDREIIRRLAEQWSGWAASPVMAERKRLWRAVHDLRAERPVILFETAWIDGYVAPKEILCQDPMLRGVELKMRILLRQAEELDDDLVLEPYYHLDWKLKYSDYGVPVEIRNACFREDTALAYSFSFPIERPEDVARLRPRTIAVDHEKTRWMKETLEDVMGDILPVRLGNIDPFVYEFDLGPYDDLGFIGNNFFGLLWQVYRFIGNQGLLYWTYDAPEAIHRLMQYMVADRIAMYEFFQREGLIVPNTDDQMAGPRSYGYVSDLPGPDTTGPTRLKDLWAWAEAQEAANLSPKMFGEFVLPYLAELSRRFGLIYYGCCERVDDRLEAIIEAIPNLRSVSVSGWSDLRKTAGMLGKKYVYSRKPVPAHLSGTDPNWRLVEKDLRDTYAAARDCNLEILYRDVYTINGDRARLRKWVDLAKSVFQM